MYTSIFGGSINPIEDNLGNFIQQRTKNLLEIKETYDMRSKNVLEIKETYDMRQNNVLEIK